MAHHFYRAALLGLTVLAAAPRSQAQNADHKTAISLYGTTLQYRGDLGTQFWNTQDSPFGGGITLSRYISKGFDLNLSGNYTKLRYPTGTGYTGGNASGQRFDAKMWSYGLGFKFKLPIKDEFFVHPYILVQPGFTWVNSDLVNGARPTVISNHSYGAFDAQGALGLDFRLSPGASLFLQAGQHFIITPDDARLDGVSSNSVTILNKYDRYLQFSAGLTFNLGKAKDTDGDGVPDRKDKCPDTPAGVKVDANGCPLDTDGDGVADYQDKCPDVKGLAALQGCPDADGDGVADADDKCPNTPAGVKVDATGCPVDTDGDKVPDYLDKCPNTPAGVQVDATGCPVDRDGDGVPDYQDKCPDRAGPASNQGCPEMKAEDKKVLNEATKYIQFAYNKATLLPVSYKRLDQIVGVLNNYPDYSLGMSGHTDDVGNEAFNLRLSYDRAASVRAYLIAKGIVATRIEARGYGKLKPIASNKTKAGQALNRRVEMDPFLTGEANPAEAKYGPAPTIAELKAKGKTAPKGAAPARKKAPAKKAPAKKAPAKKAATRK